jgi:transposase
MTSTDQYITPLSLLKAGYNTEAIALELGCSEATAYNLIHSEREEIREAQDRIDRQRRANRKYYWRRKHINAEIRRRA